MKPISDQVIVITGASSGIGLATAYRAAARGARVVLVARHRTALDAAVKAIRAKGGKALGVVADVSDRSQVQGAAAAAIRGFGGFDTWVNNAGIGMFGRTDEVSDSDHRRLFDVNYFGVVNGSLVALQHLRTRGGAIVNLGSVASDITIPLQGPYSATKAAIRSFTDGLRMELSMERVPVSVSLIRPAAIDTPFAENARNYMDREPRLPPPLFAPERVADAILDAAEHGERDYYVGTGAKLMTLFNKVVPHIVDKGAARLVPGMSQRFLERQRSPDGNLFAPGQGAGNVHGDNSATRFHGTVPAGSGGNGARRVPFVLAAGVALLGAVVARAGRKG